MSQSLAKTQGALSLLDEPIYQGSSLSADVPGKFHVAIGGRPFMLDRTFNEFGTAHKDKSIELLRPQADNSQEPSEAGINPEATWIRSQHSWHHGAGQNLFDRSQSDVSTPSDRERFRASKGIDVWTEGEISLLPFASSLWTWGTGNGHALFVSAYKDGIVFLIDFSPAGGVGDFRLQSASVTGTTALTQVLQNTFTLTGQTAYGMTTDGSNVWIVAGSDGIILVPDPIGSNSSSQYISDTVTGSIGYVKARLMVSNGASLYNVITSGSLPSALFTQANSDFTWVGFAEGTSQIYAAGYSGHKSLIYRIQVTSDGLTLDQPIVAGQLPDGEQVYSIFGYLGFIFLGTSAGARYCIPDAQGNLTIGDVIATPSPVECFAGWDRWVYFGLTNYDTTSTGIGRMDLRTLADEGAQKLAWATDLMTASSNGAVNSLAVAGGMPFATVAGVGIIGYSGQTNTTLTPSGTLTTGSLDYGMVPDKVTTSLDATFGASFTGSVSAEISADDASYDMIGYESNAGLLKQNWETRQARGGKFELRFTLTRGSSITTPVVTGWTLNAEPTGSFREEFIWPLIINAHVADESAGERYTDPQDNIDYIKSLHSTRTVVTCQQGAKTYRCVVTDYDFRRSDPNPDGSWNGVCITYLKRVAA